MTRKLRDFPQFLPTRMILQY